MYIFSGEKGREREKESRFKENADRLLIFETLPVCPGQTNVCELKELKLVVESSFSLLNINQASLLAECVGVCVCFQISEISKKIAPVLRNREMNIPAALLPDESSAFQWKRTICNTKEPKEKCARGDGQV